MKKIIKRILIVFLIFIITTVGLYYTLPLIIGLSLPDNSEIEVGEIQLLSPNGDYRYKPFEDYYVTGGSFNDYYLANNDNSIVLEGTFYSISKSDNYLAIHNMILSPANDKEDNSNQIVYYNLSKFVAEEDVYYIFNNSNKRLESFKTYNEFLDYCNKNNINFDKWIYRDVESESIKIDNNCYIRCCGQSRNQYVFIDNKPVFEGDIDKYAVIDNTRIALVFKSPKLMYAGEFDCAELIFSKIILYDKTSNSYQIIANDEELTKVVGNDFNWKSLQAYNSME